MTIPDGVTSIGKSAFAVEGQIAVACHTDTDLVSTVLNAVGDVQTDGADVVHHGIELGVRGGAVLTQHEGPGVARDDGVLEIDQGAVGGGDVVAVLILRTLCLRPRYLAIGGLIDVPIPHALIFSLPLRKDDIDANDGFDAGDTRADISDDDLPF